MISFKLTNSKNTTPKKRKMLTISQPPIPVKEERKATLTVTMTRLLERFKVLDRSIMCKANEMVPNLVSIIILFCNVFLRAERMGGGIQVEILTYWELVR